MLWLAVRVNEHAAELSTSSSTSMIISISSTAPGARLPDMAATNDPVHGLAPEAVTATRSQSMLSAVLPVLVTWAAVSVLSPGKKTSF